MTLTLLYAEARANLRLALPLIAAQMAGVGMGAIDTVMAGHLGPQALAAVAVGANVSMIFFVPFMGLFMAASAIVSQRRGAGAAPEQTGRYARGLLGLALLCGVLWCGLAQLVAAPVIHALNLPAATAQMAIDYLRAYACSSFGLCLWFALRFVAEGCESSRPVMLAGLAGLAINALFNWLLIYGIGPFPALGVVGSGVATALACLAMAGLLAVCFRHAPALRPLALWQSREREPGAFGETLRLGIPVGAILGAESGLFVLVSALMARLGESVIAAYQVAINFASLAFMIPLGIGLATTVRVGYFTGAGDHLAAARSGIAGMGLGMTNAALNATVMIAAGAWIVARYTADAGIGAQAVHFLLLAAAFQFFDGLQVTANGALRGLKDTRLPMFITLAAYWLVGLPVAVWLCFARDWGADGLWWGLTAGLAVAAAGLSMRFRALMQKSV